ncbi:MAG: hypothetical protein ACXWX6_06260 [Actinomycetota bacterium]
MTLDERLHRELESAARPADPAGVYEELIRRKERRRVVHRVERGALAAAVVAGSVAAVFVLSRVFSPDPSPGIDPDPVPITPPTPTATASPSTDDRISAIGLGLSLCDVGSVRGTFVGGGATQTAFVGAEPTRAGRCPTTQEMTGIAAIDLTGDGVADVASKPFDCEFRCDAHAAPDVDGDGIDELIVLNVGLSVSGVSLFDVVVAGDAVSLVRAMVEPPGDAILGFQGFDGSGPPQFWIGGDGFGLDSLRCERTAGGRVLISTTAQMVPPDSPDSVWEVHETSFALDDGVLRVVDARDFTELVDLGTTPSFTGAGGCGADLGRP